MKVMNIDKLKSLFDDLSDKDKRAVIFGLLAGVLIFGYFMIVSPFCDHWDSVKYKIKTSEAKLKVLGFGEEAGQKAKIRGLLNVVPVIEPAVEEDEVRKIVLEKLYDQIMAGGINLTSSPAFIGKAKVDKKLKKKVIKLRFAGKCSYQNLLKFLSHLYENPYILSLEEVKIKGDQKVKNMVDVNIMISSMVK